MNWTIPARGPLDDYDEDPIPGAHRPKTDREAAIERLVKKMQRSVPSSYDGRIVPGWSWRALAALVIDEAVVPVAAMLSCDMTMENGYGWDAIARERENE